MNQHFVKAGVLALMFAFNYDYAQQKTDSLGEGHTNIEEVVITGVADIARDRKTPVAVSTLRETQIVERLGNQEFPEILKHTPSVYTTKGSGGFGDGRINIRGFNTNNIAVMFNGIPVNDMESGSVYFSNWQGLSDVTSALQVQRGLGSSKLAIASVGGTMNFITRAADKRKGGTVSVALANHGYIKTTTTYNTGKSSSGWSSSVLFSRRSGSMYSEGTKFEGYNYYFALGYNKPKSDHDFQFTITAAPQWHMQNYQSTIATYQKYGSSEKPNRRYNPNWGYLDGEKYSQSMNFYSKPIASINWDWKVDYSSKLSSVIYASWGRGGGTGTLGSINKRSINSLPKTDDGQMRFDDIVRWNKGEYIPDFGAINTSPGSASRTNGLVKRIHVNSHDWYGFLSNFQTKMNENWNISLGIDGRYYYGYHPGVISDFWGNNSYTETYNRNIPSGYLVTNKQNPKSSFNPIEKAVKDKSQIVSRNYDGEVLWGGVFGQLEYSDEITSMFVQGSLSKQGFQRYDNWIVDGVTEQQGEIVNRKTGFKYILGYNAKTGININLDENNNVFANFGYYSKQPNNYDVYPYPQLGDRAVGNQQIVNKQLTNEKIASGELGYGFRNHILNISLNFYYTSWKDRHQRFSNLPDIPDPSTGKKYERPYANVMGIHELHMGIEYEGTLKLTDYLDVNTMFSIGDWHYKGNVSANLFDQNGTSIKYNGNSDIKLAFDKVKISDAAQTTASIGFTFKPIKEINMWSNWNYYDRYYGIVNFNEDYILETDGSKKPEAERGALRYPSYNLFDLGVSYSLNLGSKNKLVFTGNIYNLLDTYYISDARSSISADSVPGRLADGSENTAKSTYNELGYTYKGIANANQVYFGAGRTWSLGVSYKF